MAKYSRHLLTCVSTLTFALGANTVFSQTMKAPPKHANNQYILKVKDEATQKTITINLIRYNEKLYELGYKIYLINNKIRDAYVLALAAVTQREQDLKWRRRLAQVAIWNSQYQTALDQWLFIASKTKNADDIAQGKKIALQIYNYGALSDFLWIEISKNPRQQDVWQEYIKAMQIQGRPDVAISKLQMLQKKSSDPFYALQLAKLYQSLGQINKQQAALQKVKNQSPAVALQNAQILINKNKIHAAYQSLAAASQNASQQDRNFWATYAQLAWDVNDRQGAKKGYKILLSQGNVDLETYQRLVEILSTTSLKEALRIAKLGMHAFKSNEQIPLDILGLQEKLGQWHDMPAVLAQLSPTEVKTLNHDPYFWTLKAERYEYTNQIPRANAVYENGLKELPHATNLQNDYLWFLINNYNLPMLPMALGRWQHTLPATPGLWGVAAVGYRLIDQPLETNLLLSLYSQDMFKHKQDPYWMLDLADIYDQTEINNETDFPHPGNEVRRYTWPIYLRLLRRQHSPAYYDQLIDYVKLSNQEAAGDMTAVAIAMMMQNSMTPEAEELIMAWALDHENYALAQAVYTYYSKTGLLPPMWSLLSLALYQHDRYTLRSLLRDHVNKLSYRDRVKAADEIGAIPLAQKLAYQGLAQHPNDNEMYELFTDEMLKTANHVDAREEFFQYGPIQGPRTYLGATYFLTHGLSLTPYLQSWNLHDYSNSEMVNIPSHDQEVNFKAKILTEHGDMTLTVGERKSLESFQAARLSEKYRVSDQLETEFELGYHQLADDTAPLYIGGYRNDAILQLTYTLSQRDELRAQGEQNFFYTQDKYHLANGNLEKFEYEHKFWLTYPDLGVIMYAQGNQYYARSNALHGAVLNLVPSGTSATNDFMIPVSSTEYGLTAEVGTNYLDDYTHSWKPFGSATILRNSATGIGRIFTCGIAGTVFGRDHLALYYDNATDQAPGVQRELLIGLSYRYYFS